MSSAPEPLEPAKPRSRLRSAISESWATFWKETAPKWWPNLKEFFKTPANVLSITAIVATVVVPIVDKWVKSDDEMRSRLAALTDATNSVIASDGGPLAFGPGTPNSEAEQKYMIAQMKRENDLHRAVSLADSMLDEAYPSVLLALAKELCHDNDLLHAERYTDKVLERSKSSRPGEVPKLQDISGAHTVTAGCLANRGIHYAQLSADEHSKFEARMQAAVDSYSTNNGRSATIERTRLQLLWAQLEQELGNPAASDVHVRTANTLAKSLNPPDAYVLAALAAAPQATLPASSAAAEKKPIIQPGFVDHDTYDVVFPDHPGTTGALLVQDGTLHDDDPPRSLLLLYLYGNLTACYALKERWMEHDTGRAITRMHWMELLPEQHRPEELKGFWIVEHDVDGSLDGVQTFINNHPIRFVATLRKRGTPASHS